MDFLSKISVICFSCSYLVVWIIELAKLLSHSDLSDTRLSNSRLANSGLSNSGLSNSGKWLIVQTAFTIAGLFAHSVYLWFHGGLVISDRGLWVNNWYGWCLLGSWILAVAYLWLSLRQSQTHLGLFLLPIVLAMIGMGYRFGSFTSFSDRHVRSLWNWVHGFSLLLGTVVVALGCIFGLVYLAQAYRLKRKSASPRWLRLPSLEWLQQSAERCLLSSAVLLGVGLISGIAISRTPLVESSTVVKPAANPTASAWLGVNWSDPVVWTSGLLFAWLVVVMGFNLLYRPARQGRKVAYLVVVSFLFLMLELFIAWSVGHATAELKEPTGNPSAAYAKTGFVHRRESL